MQQQATSMLPVMPFNLTTHQIQKYLDDNKSLILAIMDSQNLGKLAECAQYQALLQKNLMYLAAIADAQPQTPPPALPASQIAPHPVIQQGGFYMQHPQAAAMVPVFKTPDHMQFEQQQQGQVIVRHGSPHNSTHPLTSGPSRPTSPAPHIGAANPSGSERSK